MRLWSLHPCYLDARGLVACWREGLLARKVLKGEMIGYRNHPQVERFKAQSDPVAMLDSYLLHIFQESIRRGYSFDREKIGPFFSEDKIPLRQGQLQFELRHLKEKLKKRNPERYARIASMETAEPNPVFEIIEGELEPWERQLTTKG